MGTLTLRLIRNFEYRTVKLVVLRDLELEALTGRQLKDIALSRVKDDSALKPFRSVDFDTLKIHQAGGHQFKDQNLVVNLDHSDWFIGDDDLLADKGVSNEAEVSMFNRAAYDAYAASPSIKW